MGGAIRRFYHAYIFIFYNKKALEMSISAFRDIRAYFDNYTQSRIEMIILMLASRYSRHDRHRAITAAFSRSRRRRSTMQ